MRRVALAIASTVTGLVLLLSFKTHPAGSAIAQVVVHGATAAESPAPTAQAATPTSAPAATAATVASATASASPSATKRTTTTTTKTVTGSAVDTRYGPVQVQVTIRNGKVVSAQAVEYPQESPRDEEINSYAVPQLNQEAAQASSANINMISGATYTSEGYLQSLQSALDQAGI